MCARNGNLLGLELKFYKFFNPLTSQFMFEAISVTNLSYRSCYSQMRNARD